MKSNIINLPTAVGLPGETIVEDVCLITPVLAAQWLEANKKNRPVRRRHVEFLAGEITAGNWQLNGQPIIISADEQVLDGQHRLLAIIESGKAIKSCVVYGVSPEAFKTIDTGAVRTGADALHLHFPDVQIGVIKTAATAVQYCCRLETGFIGTNSKTSNTDVILYIERHPSIIALATRLHGYPKDARPLSLGLGTALYEMFYRKNAMKADEFMRRLYTGEGLRSKEPEYLIRMRFQKDAQQLVSKMQYTVKMRMVIKAWNLIRRGITETSNQAITIKAGDAGEKVRIL